MSLRLNKTLKQKCDVLIEAMEKNFGTVAEFETPPGGIFLWVKLPAEIDTTRLAARGRQSMAFRLIRVPNGPSRGQGRNGQSGSVTPTPPLETIRKGIAALAEVSREEFGLPKTIANA